MKNLFYTLIFLLLPQLLTAQILIEWERNYGGSKDDFIIKMQKTSYGGYILGGMSRSEDGDVANNYADFDFWIIKISDNGNIEWEKNYGGHGWDHFGDLQETSDGGFIFGGYIGYSVSNEASDYEDNYDGPDFWVVKTDRYGEIQWKENYGGKYAQELKSLQETKDGGFILGGFARFSDEDGDVEDNNGNNDYWIVKTDALGNIEWTQNYGGSADDDLRVVEQTHDGGFILGGTTKSDNGDVNIGDLDFWSTYWLIKTDSIGNIEWQQCYDNLVGTNDEAKTLLQTSDGGFLLGGDDFFTGFSIFKIDGSGNIEWQQNYEACESSWDYLSSAKETSDGGFLLGGTVYYSGTNQQNSISCTYGEEDYLVIKIDEVGNIEWQQNYGGTEADGLRDLINTNDGGFILGGASASNDGDVGGNYGESDAWVFKIRRIPNALTIYPFYDTNENSIFDNDETILYNLPFATAPTAAIEKNVDGTTIFYVDNGSYTVAYNSSQNGLWKVVGDIAHFIELQDSIPTDTTLYFPMKPVTSFVLQDVDIISSITRCNRETNVWLTYTNKSSEPTSGYVTLFADELVNFVSANPPVDSIAGDTLYWFYQDLFPTHSEQIHLIYDMPDVDFIGENLDFTSDMETWEGQGPAKAVFASELICAYDPNDKLVTPSGIGEEKYTLFEDSLFNYTIRFQNTGNDTAFNVIIEDRISDYLDLSTYNFIASSHEVRTKVNDLTRVIEFNFTDIYLPDSNVNEPASHGFVKFSLETKDNLAENTPIENTANIFFDANPAIVTNTTQNNMVSMIPTDETEQPQQNIKIYPNPTSRHFSTEITQSSTVKIYNNAGQIVHEILAEPPLVQIDIRHLRAGIYFLAVETANSVVVEKIMIQ